MVPSASAALAVIEIEAGSSQEAFETGEVMLTVGAVSTTGAMTNTDTGAETLVRPLLSVALAVNV